MIDARISDLRPRPRAVDLATFAGNPAIIGTPLDRWLCVSAFRRICLLQLR
jgi:hypothetical protein